MTRKVEPNQTPKEEQADTSRKLFKEYAFDWSEASKAKCIEAGIMLGLGIPLDKVCADLGLPERDVKLFNLLARVETQRVDPNMFAEADITREQFVELRRDCLLMRGVETLRRSRGGEVSDQEKSFILRVVEPPTPVMFGLNDPTYLAFQQQIGELALTEKERLLDVLKLQTESADLKNTIDRHLQVIQHQKQHLARANEAYARAIEQAKPPSLQEFEQSLRDNHLLIQAATKEAVLKLIEQLQEADVSAKARGYGSSTNIGDVEQANTVLSMSSDKQAEILICSCILIELKSKGLHRSKFSDGMRQLVLKLCKRPLQLNKSQITVLLNTAGKLHSTSCALPAAGIVALLENCSAQRKFDKDIRQSIDSYVTTIQGGPSYVATGRGGPSAEDRSAILKLKILSRDPSEEATQQPIPIEPQEAWSDQAIADLKGLESSQRQLWLKLIDHCAHGKGTKPSGAWSKKADELTGQIGESNFVALVERWFALIPQKGSRTTVHDQWQPDPREEFCSQNVDILKGLAWCCASKKEPRLASVLGDAAEACFKKVPNLGPRCPRFGNACIHALSEMNTKEAVSQISRVQAKAKHASSKRQIDKALTNAAEHSGLTVDDLQDMSVPDFGMTEVGKLIKQIGDWQVELIVDTEHGVITNWNGPAGKTQQSVPGSLKTSHADDLKTLKKTQTELEKLLPGLRARIERSLIDQRHWKFAAWRDLYLNHPLCGILTRRLLWNFNGTTAIWYRDKLVKLDGSELRPDQDALVELWHPIAVSPDTVLQWRRWLAEREIVQPFKQVHREIYVLTDAERETAIYSNRFAAHILRQHQLQHLCLQRGWQYHLMGRFDSDNAPTLELPRWNLVVEFYIEPVEVGESASAIYTTVATDQVRFCRRVPAKPSALEERMREALGGRPIPAKFRKAFERMVLEPIALTEILPVVFSEVMRDVDLFVSVCSIGADPTRVEGVHGDYWERFSFGELNNTAKTRRQVIEELLPSLKIASRCTLGDRFLTVRGDLCTYKIHLGSGNIMMEPNDQYLCIVPSRDPASRQRLFLPFEGDPTLSVILSKAMMLAEDSKITDQSILRQIKRQ